MRGQYIKEYQMDCRQYIQSLYGEDNSSARSRLIRNMRIAISSELTPRQMEMVKMYYIDNLTMVQMADYLGVNKSTVSRTLKRSRDRLRRCLKYGAAETLREYGQGA